MQPKSCKNHWFLRCVSHVASFASFGLLGAVLEPPRRQLVPSGSTFGPQNGPKNASKNDSLKGLSQLSGNQGYLDYLRKGQGSLRGPLGLQSSRLGNL